jgi:hypothetical protein
LPSEATTSPTATTPEGWPVTVQTWGYGEVAEVLHVGQYADEAADIGRLQAFVAASGYRAIGEHEEEYVRGPGVIFAGDPHDYLTIIRLRVVPESAESPDD